MPCGITQCYLPPGSDDFPAFTPTEAGTWFSDHRGMPEWVDLCGGYSVNGTFLFGRGVEAFSNVFAGILYSCFVCEVFQYEARGIVESHSFCHQSSCVCNATEVTWFGHVTMACRSFPSCLLDNIRVMWHSVHSLQHTYMSSSYRSNRLGLSHWDPYVVCRGGCLQLYYCNMVEWFWWDSSLILTTNWSPLVLWHCWFGHLPWHLACKSRPQNDLLCVEWDVKPSTLIVVLGHRHLLLPVLFEFT